MKTGRSGRPSSSPAAITQMGVLDDLYLNEPGLEGVVARRPKLYYDGLVLAALTAVFATFAFRPRYSPDFFVQVDYLHHLLSTEIDFGSALSNNTLILDYFLNFAHSLGGVEAETALGISYTAVFLLKYVLLLKHFGSRRHVILAFLWSFYSLDVNQLRLNVAVVCFLLAVARRERGVAHDLYRVVMLVLMLGAHLFSAVLLPVFMAGWPARARRRMLAASLLLSAAALLPVIMNRFSFDERFLVYLEPGEYFVPRALLACPVMLFTLRGKFDGASRITLWFLAIVPVALALLGPVVIAARWVEVAYLAMIVKLGLEDTTLPAVKTSLLFAPAVLMFASRTILGIHGS